MIVETRRAASLLEFVSHACCGNPLIARAEFEAAEPMFPTGFHAKEGYLKGRIKQRVRIIVLVYMIPLLFSRDMEIYSGRQGRVERHVRTIKIGEPYIGQDSQKMVGFSPFYS